MWVNPYKKSLPKSCQKGYPNNRDTQALSKGFTTLTNKLIKTLSKVLPKPNGVTQRVH